MDVPIWLHWGHNGCLSCRGGDWIEDPLFYQVVQFLLDLGLQCKGDPPGLEPDWPHLWVELEGYQRPSVVAEGAVEGRRKPTADRVEIMLLGSVDPLNRNFQGCKPREAQEACAMPLHHEIQKSTELQPRTPPPIWAPYSFESL